MRSIDSTQYADPASQGNQAATTLLSSKGIANAGTSSPLLLNVSKIAAEDGRFPTPAIDEATGDELNMWTFQGDAHVTLAPWPFMSAGQRVWLDLSDASSGFPIVSNYVVTSHDVGKTLTYPVHRSSLENLKERAVITIRAHVALTGSVEDRDRLAYPMRTMTLRKARLGWDDFESYELKSYGTEFNSAAGNFRIQGSMYIDHAPAGMSGKALRLYVWHNEGTRLYYIWLYVPVEAESVSFKCQSSAQLSIVSVGGSIPAGLSNVTIKVSHASFGSYISLLGTDSYTVWIDDIEVN